MGSAVTPRAGVWIEIDSQRSPNGSAHVTPRAGVWIEILGGGDEADPERASHPVRVCGLKFCSARYAAFFSKSHPVRVCGLKYLSTLLAAPVGGHTQCGCYGLELAAV